MEEDTYQDNKAVYIKFLGCLTSEDLDFDFVLSEELKLDFLDFSLPAINVPS